RGRGAQRVGCWGTSLSQFTAMNNPQHFYSESFFYNWNGEHLAAAGTQSEAADGLGITVCIFMSTSLLVMVAIYISRYFHFPIYYFMANLAADFCAGLAHIYLMFNTGPARGPLWLAYWHPTASVADSLTFAIERHIAAFRTQLHTQMSDQQVVVVVVAIVLGAVPSAGCSCICDVENRSNMAPLRDSYLVFWAIFSLVTFVVMVVLCYIFGYVCQRTVGTSARSSGPRGNRRTMMSLLKIEVTLL
uniref:Uncharacterized protein n=1 Tax=Otolemur garnettii TaxID=30611 RepID=H0XPZ9_OTOGA